MAKKATREWYSVPVSSVQRMVFLAGLLVLMVVGAVLYKRMDLDSLNAERAFEECDERIAAARQREDAEQIKDKLKDAAELLTAADEAFNAGDVERALESGERCLSVLSAIERMGEGSIRVLSAQGSVEYRRGERGSWRRLRNHDALNPGDWVKTSGDGTAELLFTDGSLFTLRQSTMVHLGGSAGGGGEDTNIAFGQVELNTSTNERTVSTPRSEARVRRDSEAMVAFDRDRGAGRFAAFTGGLEVTSKGTGEKREVAALQQLEQLGERLAEIKSLPGRPVLSGPTDDHSIDLNSAKEVVLAWKPVDNARRYSLRVAGTRLFAANLIEDNRRAKNSARISVRREGQFYWQVAAMDGKGNLGPWSETRSFRAASLSRTEDISDKEPPELDIISTETYGTFVIVSGKTESGATLTINGESVDVKSNGAFRSTIQLKQAGWNVLEIVSTDSWSNSSTVKKRVHVDAI